MYDELIDELRLESVNMHYEKSDCELFARAADAIEVLSKMETTTPRWISVEERLPSKNGEYLALSKHYAMKGQRYDILNYAENLESVDKYDFEGQDRRGWYWYDDEYGYIETDRVTHWMPLPEPPKEET